MNYQEYLDSLSTEEKEYVSNFFKKKEYIEKLNETAIGNCKENIASSKGNCNSKIAVIVNNYKDLDTVTKFIKPMFETINTSLWNIYITSVIKSDDNNELFSQMIQYEVNAVSPLFSFMFVDDKQSFTEEGIVYLKKTVPTVYINMDDVNYVLNKENFKTERYFQIMNGFYKYVLQIIQYREIEIAE